LFAANHQQGRALNGSLGSIRKERARLGRVFQREEGIPTRLQTLCQIQSVRRALPGKAQLGAQSGFSDLRLLRRVGADSAQPEFAQTRPIRRAENRANI